MRRQEAMHRLRDGFATLSATIRAGRALEQTDLNRLCEDVLCPILRISHDLPGLRNLNDTERAAFPGVDLGDAGKGVAIQVTATADAAKIRHTLRTCVKHRVYERFPRLLIYVLDQKQAEYRIDVADDSQGLVQFAVKTDVLDFTDVLKALGHRPVDQIEQALTALETEWGRPAGVPPISVEGPEQLWLNLAPLVLPDVLYVADLVPEAAPKRSRKGERAAAKDHLAELGLKFAVDWTVHERQVVTFRDLSDRKLPLAKITDAGTVTTLRPDEYFTIGLGFEDAFKDLLRRSLQQKLFPRGVRWQHQEHLFIFASEAEALRRTESWMGEKQSTRKVFERVPKRDDPAETYHCKHLAFAVSFHAIGNTWHICLKPDWFFSRDGYRKWAFGAERVEWLKRNEQNQHVFNHLKFLIYFLQNDPPPDLFRDFAPYPYLQLGELMTLDGGGAVPDQDWQSGEEEAARRRLADPLGDLPLFSGHDETDSAP